MGHAVVNAAGAAEVEHFVRFSVTHPQLEPLLNHQAKLTEERAVLPFGERRGRPFLADQRHVGLLQTCAGTPASSCRASETTSAMPNPGSTSLGP